MRATAIGVTYGASMRTACWLIAAAGCTTIDDGFALEIEARGAQIVVVQDGSGAWERLQTTPDGIAYRQILEGHYGVGALCSEATWKSASFVFDTQPRTVFLQCPISTSAAALHVSGTTEPMAEVWVDGRSTRANATGEFELSVDTSGLHDVVAILASMPPRIVARRAVAITGDTRVNLSGASSVEMTALYPTVTGANRDAIQLSSDLNTSTDWISLGSSSSAVYVPPASFLELTDRPAIAASAHGCTRQHPLAAANEPIVLPAPLAYTLDRSRLDWIADPSVAWDSAIVDIHSSEGGRYMAFASASYREATEAHAIPIVDLAALPGWTTDLPRLVADEPAWFGFSLSQGAFDGDLTYCGATVQFDRW
jgi:hypothetical protein